MAQTCEQFRLKCECSKFEKNLDDSFNQLDCLIEFPWTAEHRKILKKKNIARECSQPLQNFFLDFILFCLESFTMWYSCRHQRVSSVTFSCRDKNLSMLNPNFHPKISPLPTLHVHRCKPFLKMNPPERDIEQILAQGFFFWNFTVLTKNCSY